LFGLSNRGAPVPTSALATDQASRLERLGFSDGVRKLGERKGTAFYAGRARNGALCFATGPTTRPAPAFGVLACQGGEGDVFPSQRDVFPSRRVPIADLSPLRGHEGSNGVYVWKLVGFAADGVAAVAVRDVTGALRATEVAGNIYASDELPVVAATEILALDADGNVL
jgi:hypothetical protein